jgi:hypothetical protein
LIGGTDLVNYTIFSHQNPNGLLTKMLSPITNHSLGHAKTRENIFFQEFDHNSMVIGSRCNGLHPFRHIINNYKDELEPKKLGKGPMKSIPK